MNEEIKTVPEYERIDPEVVKKDLRRTYSRCGWILLVFTAIGYFVPRAIDGFIDGAGDEVKRFVGEYLLIHNAILIGIATLAAAQSRICMFSKGKNKASHSPFTFCEGSFFLNNFQVLKKLFLCDIIFKNEILTQRYENKGDFLCPSNLIPKP